MDYFIIFIIIFTIILILFFNNCISLPILLSFPLLGIFHIFNKNTYKCEGTTSKLRKITDFSKYIIRKGGTIDKVIYEMPKTEIEHKIEELYYENNNIVKLINKTDNISIIEEPYSLHYFQNKAGQPIYTNKILNILSKKINTNFSNSSEVKTSIIRKPGVVNNEKFWNSNIYSNEKKTTNVNKLFINPNVFLDAELLNDFINKPLQDLGLNKNHWFGLDTYMNKLKSLQDYISTLKSSESNNTEQKCNTTFDNLQSDIKKNIESFKNPGADYDKLMSDINTNNYCLYKLLLENKNNIKLQQKTELEDALEQQKTAKEEELQQQKTELETQITTLQEQKTAKEAELQQQKQKCEKEKEEELQQQKQKCEEQKEALRKEKAELTKSKEELAAKETTFTTQLAAKETELAAKETTLQQKETELTKSKEELAAKEEELQEQKTAKEAELAAKEEELQQQKTELETQITTLQEQKTAKEEELAAKEAELAAKEAELAAKEVELQQQKQGCEEEKKTLEQQKQALEEALRKEITTLQEQKTAKEAELAAKEVELQQQKQKCEEQKEALRKQKEEELAAKKQELETALQQQKKELADIEDNIEEVYIYVKEPAQVKPIKKNKVPADIFRLPGDKPI